MAMVLVLGSLIALPLASAERAPGLFTGPVLVSTGGGAASCSAATGATLRIYDDRDAVELALNNPCAPLFYDGAFGLTLVHWLANWKVSRDCVQGADGVLACANGCDAMLLAPDGAFHYRFTQVTGPFWQIDGHLIGVA